MSHANGDVRTAKSQLRVVAEYAGLVTLLGAALGTSYQVGKEVRDGEASKASATQDSKHSSELSEIKGDISILQTSLTLAQSKQEAAENEATQWKAAYSALLKQLDSEQKNRQELTVALSKSDNCAFIHEQIRSLQTEIRNSTMVWMGADGIAREKERRNPLETQIRNYQEQLGNCNN
ncbi:MULTISPECIES: hypothetical protein [Xanthomonas]|uniref:hypothetical protein n=1 Tax=Xanthomonas TaxID=338 RepID=UPI0011AFD2B1|nr:hypothetical protein [Xanthomonas arboricola]NJC03210.1 chromosome segregation ATPase [Xanthomonas arboricola]